MAMKLNSNESKTLAEINVTPFVDVLLVLLVIFMVTAPLSYTGITVDLPKTYTGQNEVLEEKIVLTIDKDKVIYVNKTQYSTTDLKEKLSTLYKNRQDRSLYINADKTLTYDYVVGIIDTAKQSGVLKIGMVTSKKVKDN